jgi:hypothetical protein
VKAAWRRLPVLVPALPFVALVGLSTANAIRHPFYNWDIIGYVATAARMEGRHGPELLATTRDAVQDGVGDPLRRELLLRGTSPYQKTVLTDARALEQQLPLDAPRFLYVGGIVALHTLGMQAVSASVWMSAVPVALLAAFLWWCAFRRVGPRVATTLVCAGALVLDWPTLASFSTPDGLAMLLSVSGSIVLARSVATRQSLASAAALLALSVAARHDLFAPIALCATRGAQAWPRVLGRLASVVTPAVVVFAAIAVLSGWYGRDTVLAYAFIGPMPYPADAPLPDVGPAYWTTVRTNLNAVFTAPWLYAEVWAIPITALSWYWASARWRLLMLVGIVEISLRFALFPVAGSGWQRLYMTPIVLTLSFATAAALDRLARSRTTSPGNALS